MPRTKTSWKPGQSGNPKGRPLNPYVEKLNIPIEKVQKEQDYSLLEHFVRRAYENDRVLIAIMRKLLPDLKYVDENVQAEGDVIPQTWVDLLKMISEKNDSNSPYYNWDNSNPSCIIKNHKDNQESFSACCD